MTELSNIAKNITPSAMQIALNIPDKHKYISFALGLPANEALPLSLLKESAVLCDENSDMQYSPPLQLLKSQIKNLVKERGIHCEEDEIFLTAGAQQGISLLVRLLVNEGSQVIAEELVYPGFLQAIQSVRSSIITIPSDYMSGIRLYELENTIKNYYKKPALIYIVADGSNPLGVSLNLENRKKLVLISQKYQIPILEDDPYGLLYYGEKQYPALKSFGAEDVCYIGSFSKIIAPALRIGWIIAPKYLIPKLSVLKESSDIDMGTFSQRIASNFIKGNNLEDHLPFVRKLYKEKRDFMCKCIDKYLPPDIKYTIPENGIYLWLEFDKSVDTEVLFRKARDQKVIIIPGNSFSSRGEKVASNCIRLNFSFSSAEQIEEGIKRIANSLDKTI